MLGTILPKIVRISSLIFVLAMAPVAFSQGDSSALTAEQRNLNLQSLEKIFTTVRDTHWDPTLGGVDWNAAHQRALLKLKKAEDMRQARAVMSDMLAKLKQSHFAVIPADLYQEIQPASKNRRPAKPQDNEQPDSQAPRIKAPADSVRREELCGVGLEALVIDGKARVIAIDADSPAFKAGIHLGWEVVSVDGLDLANPIKMLAAADLREREMYQRAILEEAFLGPRDETLEAVFSDGESRIHKLTLERTEPKGNLAKLGFLPATRVWLESRELNGPIGYVRFNAFLDPEKLMPAFEKAVRDCAKCQGFIIDLRGNPGGIGAMSMGMAGWFVARKGRRLGTLKARDSSTEYVINPRVNAFEGPLAILVDGGSASTSEIFAAGLQDLGRARVFGTKTAGAALPSQVIRLPNLDGFQYAEANYTSRNGLVLEGAGVTPDVLVEHTRASLLAGRDTALDAAVNWIPTAN